MPALLAAARLSATDTLPVDALGLDGRDDGLDGRDEGREGLEDGLCDCALFRA